MGGIIVSFKEEKRNIFLFILDNGRGFDNGIAVKGIGLKNIESRVKDFNGRMQLITNKKGTEIRIKIPKNK